MFGDEIVHAEAFWPGPPIGVEPLEVERTLARKELASGFDDEAIDDRRIRGPGVDDDAVSIETLIVAQPGATFNPLLRKMLMG